jgi:hypothetical protein
MRDSKNIYIEKTKYIQNYRVPNLSPIEAINSLASRSQSEVYTGSNYTFFETLDSFNYKTISSLIDAPIVEEYNYVPSNIGQPEESDTIQDRNILSDIHNVEKYIILEQFDHIRSLSKGMYGSRNIVVDSVRKRYFENDYIYSKEFPTQTHLAKNTINTTECDLSSSPECRINLTYTYKDHDIIPWIGGVDELVLPSHIDEAIQHRQSQMQQLNNTKLKLTVVGNSERKAGQTIQFNLPVSMGKVEDIGEVDPYISGKYLIVGLVHHIEPSKYWLELDVVKDSYEAVPEYIDPFPIYKGTW